MSKMNVNSAMMAVEFLIDAATQTLINGAPMAEDLPGAASEALIALEEALKDNHAIKLDKLRSALADFHLEEKGFLIRTKQAQEEACWDLLERWMTENPGYQVDIHHMKGRWLVNMTNDTHGDILASFSGESRVDALAQAAQWLS